MINETIFLGGTRAIGFGDTPIVGMPNPASVNCGNKGGALKIVDTPKGQSGICVFPDGSQCEEWALFRGACAPGAQPKEAVVCPPGSTPTFYPDGTYQCLMPDGSVPIKPNFPLPPGFTTCGAGFELHDGRCYDPREWATLVAGKGWAGPREENYDYMPNQDTTTLEKSIYAGTGVIVVGGIIWLLVRR